MLSLEKISMILEKVPSFKINKIIYTSSASVYRVPENLSSRKTINLIENYILHLSWQLKNDIKFCK